MDDRQFDTLLRKAHTVAPPAPELVRQERAWFDAFVAEPSAPVSRSIRSRHRRRAPLLLGVVGAGMLGSVGAAAAGLFDPSTARMVNDADCGISTDDAELITSETDSAGDLIELWVVHSDVGFGHMLVDKAADGAVLGSELGCTGRSDVPDDAGTWATSGSKHGENIDGTIIRMVGRIADGSPAAVVTLTDGTQVTVTPDKNGYFLHLYNAADDSDSLDVVSIETLESNEPWARRRHGSTRHPVGGHRPTGSLPIRVRPEGTWQA